MDSKEVIYLNVKTIPTFDAVEKTPHTAFTVYYHRKEVYYVASAWTLKDAVQLYRRLYCVDDQTTIKLVRPFKPQVFKRTRI